MKLRIWTMLLLMSLTGGAQAVRPDKEAEPPPLTYQIVTVRFAGGSEDEAGSVLIEQQTGRSWILVQRGSTPPVWQALPFEAGLTLSQQLLPPETTLRQAQR